MPLDPLWFIGRDVNIPLCPKDDEWFPYPGRYWVPELNPHSSKCDYIDDAHSVYIRKLFLQLVGEGWPCLPVEFHPMVNLDDANDFLPGIAAMWEPEQPGHFYGDNSITSWCSPANFAQRFDMSLFPPAANNKLMGSRKSSLNVFNPDFPCPSDFNRALEAYYSRVYLNTKCCEQARKLMHPASWHAPALI